MVLFAVIFNIAEFVVVVVVVVQFITKLFTGDVHERLQEFGDSIAQYIAEIVRYLTFHTENVPFPFGEWPKGQVARRKRTRKKKASAEQQEDMLETASSGGTSTIGGGTDESSSPPPGPPPTTPPTSGGSTSS